MPDLALPWIQGDSTPEDEHGDNACNIYDEDSGGNLIAECENPETTAFIVKAVNCHEELLEALKAVTKGVLLILHIYTNSVRNINEHSKPSPKRNGNNMKTPKFAGPITKPKPIKKTHITKKEYQKTKASMIDKALNKFFAGMKLLLILSAFCLLEYETHAAKVSYITGANYFQVLGR